MRARGLSASAAALVAVTHAAAEEVPAQTGNLALLGRARSWLPNSVASVPTVIDGVGTELATLNYTNANQACLRRLCDEAGKETWTDVEVAVMGRKYEPMPMGRVAASLEVAAEHADTIVAFCYFSYMSPNNGRALAARLYEERTTARCVVASDYEP